MPIRPVLTPLLALLLVAAACEHRPHPRSELSFDEIAARIATMRAAEIARWLGEPDSRKKVFLRDERWIWWNYTFLDGDDYPPEIRGRIVHLEITLRDPAEPGRAPRPMAEWTVARPFGVEYRLRGPEEP